MLWWIIIAIGVAFGVTVLAAFIYVELTTPPVIPRKELPGEREHLHFCPHCWTKWGGPEAPEDWALCHPCWKKLSRWPCDTCGKPRLFHLSGIQKDGSINESHFGGESCRTAELWD